MEFMGSPWMTTFSLIVALTNPPVPVAAPSRVSSAISRPYDTPHCTADRQGIVSPESRRAEFSGSGAPSWTTAQPQAAGDCRVRRSVRPDEGGEGIREADGLPGKRPLVLLAIKSGSFKVTRPGPKGGRNPVEGKTLAFYGAKPHPERSCAMHCADSSPWGCIPLPLAYSEPLLEQPLRAAPCISAEFARLAGTTPKAVRLYEQLGLLPEPRRRGKYRVYRAEDLEWVGFIREAQRLGCKLGELVPLLAGVTSLDHFPWQKVEQLIADKLAQIGAEVARLQRQHQGLSQCATLLAQHPAAMAPRRSNPRRAGSSRRRGSGAKGGLTLSHGTRV